MNNHPFAARLAELCAAATPGPWIENGTIVGRTLYETDASTSEAEPKAWITYKTPRPDADRKLDIYLRNHTEAILALVEAVTEVELNAGLDPARTVALVAVPRMNRLRAALEALSNEP